MAKFIKLKHKRGYLDCLKFFQATLSGGSSRGFGQNADKRKKIKPQNPDIDGSKTRLSMVEDFAEEEKVTSAFQDQTNSRVDLDDIGLAESHLKLEKLT